MGAQSEYDPEAKADAGEFDALSRKFQKELSAGLVALVLLAVLDQAGEGTFIKQGALYPVLRNLSAAGLLSSRVVPSYSGPPRRYYGITPAGRRALAQWRVIWSGTRDFVNQFIETTGERS